MDQSISEVKISFIIPALNEEKYIGLAIDSIKKSVTGKYPYQIIVCDNGSVDGTVVIAEQKGAMVVHRPGVKISALRNSGARLSQGVILVFIDADVWLHDSWGNHIEQTIDLLEKESNVVTGSICAISENGSWIERYWFGSVVERRNVNYVNSGHIIVTGDTFEKIGGFNEYLETGEDYEFCQRAIGKGIKIINNPLLKVIHEGYPKDIREFYRRERWHGKGDYASLKAIFRSKPALLSISQLIVLCLSIIMAVSIRSRLFLFYFIYLIGISVSSGFYRTRKVNRAFWVSASLYIVYFWARSLSFYDTIVASITDRYNQ